MPKQLVLGAFEELSPNFLSNAWHHPRADTTAFATLPYWQHLARTLDEAGFDFLFFADALGYPMSGGSVPETVIREAVEFPVHDPLMIISGLAAVAPRIGFVVTASTTAQHPYLNARAFTTLDHLTNGRIGWNIVTSDLQEALVRMLGHDGITPHDERYARAAEFLDLELKLWEGSWDDDAVVADKARAVYTEPAKVHRIAHSGTHFRYDGYFPLTPSPQRTPTLFQAGTSTAGRAFAGRVAELVFVQDREIGRSAATVTTLRDAARAQGRGGDDVKVVNGVSVVVGATEAEARRKRAELEAAPSRDAVATLFLGWSGVDLSKLDPHSTLDEVATEVGQTMVARWRNPDGASPTVAEVIDSLASTMGGFRVTGTAEQAADQLAEIAAGTDLDGFLVQRTYGGVESYREFVDDVVPILRARGLLPARPRHGTLREMVTGAGPFLPESHPGAAVRAARRTGSPTAATVR